MKHMDGGIFGLVHDRGAVAAVIECCGTHFISGDNSGAKGGGCRGNMILRSTIGVGDSSYEDGNDIDVLIHGGYERESSSLG